MPPLTLSPRPLPPPPPPTCAAGALPSPHTLRTCDAGACALHATCDAGHEEHDEVSTPWPATAARKDSVSHRCCSLASPWWLCRLPGSAMLPCGIAPCAPGGAAPCDDDEPVPTCPCLSTPPPARSAAEPPPRRLQALASSADSCGHSPAFMLSAVGEGCPCEEEAMTAARSADSCHSPPLGLMPLCWLAAWPSRERPGKLARPMLQLFSCSIRSSTGAFG
mmetsp:Transcript_6452/g.15945  ORF Transcript_6452/g.15945 Transcript_6452/m.15945 type:complete len:221 (+) Transcript_6452:355-1017(+)